MEQNIDVAGVTKCFCGNPIIAREFLMGGVSYLADSRLENLKKLRMLDVPKIMIRLPMISEIEEVVKYADISLNSELDTVKKIGQVASSMDKVHGIVLMVDLGDLREGFFNKEDIISACEEVNSISGVKLMGIGTNLSCYGGVVPTCENLGRLTEIKESIENRIGRSLDIVSGGNSSSYQLVEAGKMPCGVNNLRLGTMLLLGHDEVNDKWIKGTYHDCFILKTEIVEIKDKPSKPIGEIGKDAFGNVPAFEDEGIIKRAICAIGKQDTDIKWMEPLDGSIKILGASSDHLILDISKSKMDYHVGSIVEFQLDYVAILSVMNSTYVRKVIKNRDEKVREG